jgi:aspartate racemase
MIATNTMHKVAKDVQKAIDIPLIDIRDVTNEAIKKDGLKKVLLLGTKFTMEDDFYKQKLEAEVVIPSKSQRDYIHKVIFEKLCNGIVEKEDKEKFLEVIEKSDAQGVILGCTEIGLLITQKDTSKKVYDTTILHSQKAVELMI